MVDGKVDRTSWSAVPPIRQRQPYRSTSGPVSDVRACSGAELRRLRPRLQRLDESQQTAADLNPTKTQDFRSAAEARPNQRHPGIVNERRGC